MLEKGDMSDLGLYDGRWDQKRSVNGSMREGVYLENVDTTIVDRACQGKDVSKVVAQRLSMNGMFT